MTQPSPSDLSDAARNGRAYALLTITAMCWAANAVFGQLAIGEVSPMVLVALRWLGVTLLLSIFARRQILRNWPLLRPNLAYLFAMGALGFAAFNATFYVAAYSTTAVNMGIIQGAMPMVVIIGAYLAYQTRVTRMQVAGVLATIVGIAVLASGGDLARLAALAFNRGDLLMLGAAVMYGTYTVGLRRCPAVSPLALLSVLAVSAFVTSIPMVVAEAMLGQLQWPSQEGWAIVAAVTVFPSMLAQAFFIRGVALIGPGRAGVFINLVPVFASILAVTFLDESFEMHHTIALTLVLFGIALSERGKTKAGHTS
ncbi:MAG: DMT family transporter [Alphaproteobacteria bacterium]|jgi:drug/metabolite transporter (DMT)-like permease|nr:DMT family transporter [Alphaproteobacteria bacterium]